MPDRAVSHKVLWVVIVLGGISWFVLHLLMFLLVALAFDGCTKCPYTENADRWNNAGLMAKAFALAAVFDAALMIVLYQTAKRAGHAMRRYTLAVSLYAVSFVGFYCFYLAGELRCGSDCLPPHPLSDYANAVSYLTLPALAAAFAALVSSFRSSAVFESQRT